MKKEEVPLLGTKKEAFDLLFSGEISDRQLLLYLVLSWRCKKGENSIFTNAQEIFSLLGKGWSVSMVQKRLRALKEKGLIYYSPTTKFRREIFLNRSNVSLSENNLCPVTPQKITRDVDRAVDLETKKIEQKILWNVPELRTEINSTESGACSDDNCVLFQSSGQSSGQSYGQSTKEKEKKEEHVLSAREATFQKQASQESLPKVEFSDQDQEPGTETDPDEELDFRLRDGGEGEGEGEGEDCQEEDEEKLRAALRGPTLADVDFSRFEDTTPPKEPPPEITPEEERLPEFIKNSPFWLKHYRTAETQTPQDRLNKVALPDTDTLESRIADLHQEEEHPEVTTPSPTNTLPADRRSGDSTVDVSPRTRARKQGKEEQTLFDPPPDMDSEEMAQETAPRRLERDPATKEAFLLKGIGDLTHWRDIWEQWDESPRSWPKWIKERWSRVVDVFPTPDKVSEFHLSQPARDDIKAPLRYFFSFFKWQEDGTCTPDPRMYRRNYVQPGGGISC